MSFLRRFLADCRGATAIEVAFALPALVLMMWLIMQLALVYRAVAGIQQALGEGARYATLCINPTTSVSIGCWPSYCSGPSRRSHSINPTGGCAGAGDVHSIAEERLNNMPKPAIMGAKSLPAGGPRVSVD